MEPDNEERLITEAEIERLRKIFDRDRKVLSDEDLLRLAELVEDESDESNLVIDRDDGGGSVGG